MVFDVPVVTATHQLAEDVKNTKNVRPSLITRRPSAIVAIFLAAFHVLTDPTMLALLPHNRYTNIVKFAGLTFIVYRQISCVRPIRRSDNA